MANEIYIKANYQDLNTLLTTTEKIDKAIDGLNKKRLEIKDNIAEKSERVDALRKNVNDLTDDIKAFRRALEVDPNNMFAKMGLDAAKEDLRAVTKALHDEQAALRDSRREYTLYTNDISKLSQQRSEAKKQEAQAEKEAAEQRQIHDRQEEMAMERFLADQDKKNKALEDERKIREANNRAYSAMWREEAYAAEQAAERQREAFEAFNNELEQTEQLAERVSGIFNAVGAVSGATAEFAGAIGNAFSGMSGLFETDIAKYATASLTHQITQRLVGNISSVTSRYDILNTFLPYMSIVGVDEAESTELLNRIDQSIRGLPIGLDEAAQRFRRYNMYLGDAQRAANLTIGLQSLITAGGSGDSYKTQAYNMIERILATGDLTNIRQWQALMVGLGVSQKFISEELGVENGSLLDAIRSGTVQVDEFLAAIERLGTGTTRAAYHMQDALDIYKSTLESWMKNIEYAVTRGNVAVLNALNDTLTNVTGKGLTGYMREWRDTENNIFGWTANYIRNNPEQIATIIGYVESLFGAISRFSASDFIQYGLKYLGDLISMIQTFLGSIPEERMEKFAAFATTMAGTLGKIFGAAGDAPFMMAVFDRFEDFDWDMFAQDLASAARSMADILSSILQMVSDPVMSKLLAYGLIFGRPVQGVMNTLGNGLVTGAGLLTQFRLWRYMRGAGTGFGTAGEMADLAAIEGGRAGLRGSLSSAWGSISPILLPALGTGGAMTGITALLAAAGNAYDESRINEILTTLSPQTVGGYKNAIEYVNNLLKDRINPDTGALSTDTDTQYLVYLKEAYQRAYEEAINKLPKRYKDAYNITQHLSGNAEEFAWFESAPATYIDSTTESVNKLADSYWTLRTAAQESIYAQIQLWGGASKEIEGHVETISEIVNRVTTDTQQKLGYVEAVLKLMEYATPENMGVINSLIESGADNLDQINYVLEELEKKSDALDPLAEGMEEAEVATQGLSDVVGYLKENLDEFAGSGYTRGQMLGQMLAEGIDAGAGEAARAAWRFAYGVQIALNSIRIPDYFSHFNETNEEYTWEQPGKYATGGLIYAANGKLINFEPRGTDTVPAMLTPGEFVMRKQAVDTFGAAFMKSINDLNIGAAFDRLINTKLSNPRGFVNNTYNNRDDHSTHIQNIKTNNPAFAAKRAGRFVRAMA